MKIRGFFAVAAFLFCLAMLAASAHAQLVDSGAVKYSWAGKKMDGALWGLASGDVDGDGSRDLLLLERRAVRIGKLDADGFKQTAKCDIPGFAFGARIYAFDLDGDSRDEIIVSAVEDKIPSSAAFSYADGKCRTLFDRARWSLRVAANKDGNQVLIGQGWNSDSYFFGPVYEMRLADGKPASGDAIDLPRPTRLYQFSFVQGSDPERVAFLRGWAAMEVREKSGKKFKKIWRSPTRLGGSPNQLEASQRDVLGSEDSQSVIFDTPPIPGSISGASGLIAVHSNMTTNNVIGTKPSISGAKLQGFAEDQGVVFAPRFETMELPTCIVDLIPGGVNGNQPGRVLALVQNECGLFAQATESQLIEFDLPGFAAAGR